MKVAFEERPLLDTVFTREEEREFGNKYVYHSEQSLIATYLL